MTLPFFLLVGFMTGNSLIDLNLHDTYYIIRIWYLTFLAIAIVGLTGTVYLILKLLKLKPRIRLTKWNVWLTQSGIFILLALAVIISDFGNSSSVGLEWEISFTIIILMFLQLHECISKSLK